MFDNMNLSEIKEYIKTIPVEKYPELIGILQDDKRKTVQKYRTSLHNIFLNYQKEYVRTEKLKQFERLAYKKGYKILAGIDEVGRGPLAGPVVSAALVLPRDFDLLYIDDSKKLSPQKREDLFVKIHEKALDIGIGIVDSHSIDDINIYQATKISMALAVKNLKNKPDLLLIDGIRCENIPIKQVPIIKGDSKSISIAAASIIAKVTRDRIMDDFHKDFPNYAFNKNKGYGTEEHRRAIKKFGPLDIHRKTFLGKIIGS